MSKESDKKKGISWLRPGIFSQDSAEGETVATEEAIVEDQGAKANRPQAGESRPQVNYFSKEGQDKIVLDFIVPLENILKERQLLLYKSKGLEDQLRVANDTIQRIQQDLVNMSKNVQKKSAEIKELENNLTTKQMSYDQLLEDYKEFQAKSHTESTTLLNKLDAEISKYNKLSEETKEAQYKNLLKISELEEKIRILEIDNQQYIENYKKAFSEKNDLLKTINDFTKQMSFTIQPTTKIDKEQE